MGRPKVYFSRCARAMFAKLLDKLDSCAMLTAMAAALFAAAAAACTAVRARWAEAAMTGAIGWEIRLPAAYVLNAVACPCADAVWVCAWARVLVAGAPANSTPSAAASVPSSVERIIVVAIFCFANLKSRWQVPIWEQVLVPNSRPRASGMIIKQRHAAKNTGCTATNANRAKAL